jgi:pyridinium-3,5-biscarboxylic acid mononucleotide sulfurtransferase
MPLSDELLSKRERMLAILHEMGRVVVAFSGGVDSAVVAKGAFEALGDNAIAVTADSPSVARRELADARRIAMHIGIAHRVIATDEFANADYARNDGSRCYYCKDEVYGRIASQSDGLVVSGANVDDAGDYRPGLTAAAEHGVRHPLQEAGLTKTEVRELARHWGLDVWDKPASPCLSSRIAPGVAATPERTARIEAAETLLHEMGLRECRVRLHEGELARIEVPLSEVAEIAAARDTINKKLRELGFRYVTLDLGGFRSGSLNELVTLETRRKFAKEAIS